MLEKLYSFLAHGVVRVLQDWLVGGTREPPEELAAILTDLCNYGVSGFVDLTKIQPPVERRYRKQGGQLA